MASSAQSASSSLPIPTFRGSYVPTHPATVDEVTQDSLEELLVILDRLDTLWIEYANPSSIRKALRAQEQLDANFEIGLGWMIQRAIFRADFDGTDEEFQQHLVVDKALHSAVAEICAAESMSTISQKFADAISNLNQSIEGTETLDLSLFEFAGPFESEETFEIDFVHKAISWIESHGENSLEDPRLITVENVRVGFWEFFRVEDNNQDQCVGDEHRLGRNLWSCPTCAVHVALQKLDIPGPSYGRLSRNSTASIDQAMTESTDDEKENNDEGSDEEPAFSPVINVNVAVPTGVNQPTQPAAALLPAVVPAAVINPVPQTQAQSIVPLATAVPVLAPAAAGLFKPVYVQIKANGNNGLVPLQAPMNIAAILARSANLPDAQKDSRLTWVGGVRYLCPYTSPAGVQCSCYFQCRPDLAKHGRVDHGVHPFPAADWAEIGPYNVDEMRILRPGRPFNLRSARDPAHMR